MFEIKQDLQDLNNFIRVHEKTESKWKKHLKCLYDSFSVAEESYSLPKSSDALNTLHIDGLDTEQIWQQLELLNGCCKESPTNVVEFSSATLPSKVAYLKYIGKENPSLGLFNSNDSSSQIQQTIESSSDSDSDISGDEGLGLDEESDDEDDDDDAEDALNDLNSDMEVDELDDDEPEEKKDLDDIDEDLIAGLSDSDSDLDAQCGDLKDEGEESDEDLGEEEEEDLEKIGNKPLTDDDGNPLNIPDFSKTELDSQFLQIRESEWIADNDMIGENCPDNFDEIDFMSDLKECDEDTIMYKDFFAEPTKNKKSFKHKQQRNNNDAIESEEESNIDQTQENIPQNDNENEEETENTHRQLLGDKKNESKSLFEKLSEKDKEQFTNIEERNIAPKDWVMKGEILSTDRPENSVLEENLEYTVTASQRPVTTEETTEKLEKFILSVVRSGAFDDVERKIKPTRDPNEYKKKLLLDQTKSQKSLAEIYEEEYLKKKAGEKDEAEEEIPEHTEIRTQMTSLFSMLDALANYHYTPKQKMPELKIVSNLPAISMEESTPATVNDANLLAPQEVVESKRGELIGKTERTTTDQNRERRKKKKFQKEKANFEDLKLKKKLKSLGNANLDVSTSAKVVEKAIKRGQVKMMESSNTKVPKSFKDHKTSKRKTGDESDKKNSKRPKTNIESSTKLLL